jgi:hypothetical protein
MGPLARHVHHAIQNYDAGILTRPPSVIRFALIDGTQAMYGSGMTDS